MFILFYNRVYIEPDAYTEPYAIAPGYFFQFSDIFHHI